MNHFLVVGGNVSETSLSLVGRSAVIVVDHIDTATLCDCWFAHVVVIVVGLELGC